MKHHNLLKGLRVVLAIVFFIPMLLFFLDFSGKMPLGVHRLLHLQLLPAILAGMLGVVAVMLLLTLLMGRVYCSVICPMGVLQDVINRLFCLGKKKKKGARRFSYHKPMNLVRYALLLLSGVTLLLGFSGLCLLIDPYSNFGRIATNLFRPAVMWGNNMLAEGLMRMDNYSLFQVTISTVSIAGLMSGVVALVVVVVLVIFRGRLFCNTLCPVGALLSLVSRYSFFRITFNKDTCTHCGNCEHSCKAEAIDAKHMTVDTSRCVDCFNCISSCPKGDLKYRFNPPWNKEKENNKEVAASESRRLFIATGATLAASLPLANAAHGGKKHRGGKGPSLPLTPPGSLSLERFKDKCTGCHLCVVRCPSQVLRPAGMEYGFEYLLKPRMAYINSYCNYDCTICSEVCPSGAIHPITKEEKRSLQVGVATFFKGRCIVNTEETDCGACSEHCPTQAVHMVPYKGTLTIPEVNPELCVGCGGCESICPVRPLRAIIVKPNAVHQHIEIKEEEASKGEVEVDDFGF